MLEFIHVDYSYGEKRIFENLNLSFPDNSVTAIMGRSGSGKTTLLKLAAGIRKQDAGIIRSDGIISYSFQEPRLIPSLTVLDNLRIVLKKSADSEEKVREMLEKLGIGQSAETYPEQLSGGMAKRAGLARALIYKSDILLIDEPFGELDEHSRDLAATAIRENSDGKTVLVVVHEKEHADMIGAKIMNI